MTHIQATGMESCDGAIHKICTVLSQPHRQCRSGWAGLAEHLPPPDLTTNCRWYDEIQPYRRLYGRPYHTSSRTGQLRARGGHPPSNPSGS
eukprot:361800-Chlamydomonas_euryale.AAC.2